MKEKRIQKILGVFLTLCIFFTVSSTAFAAPALDQIAQETASYLAKTVTNPTVSSVGGEWAVLGLSRLGETVPQTYYDTYYNNLTTLLKTNNGVLSNRKYTDYSRVVLALTAIGKDPTNVAGYNLLLPLADYDKTLRQGINGPIFALLALHSGNYELPKTISGTQATTADYLSYILKKELPTGGFALTGTTADPDLTGMVLQALAPYQSQPEVANVIETSLARLSQLQAPNGTFDSWGVPNSESISQVLVALGELDIPYTDSRFVKAGNTLVDGLLTYRLPNGGFQHLSTETEANVMATEQCLYALTATLRQQKNLNSLYDMTDVATIPASVQTVQVPPVITPGKTFPDIQGDAGQTAIEALASRGIINGSTAQSFEPQRTMTRAEFATILVKALGLSPVVDHTFADVPTTAWFAPYIGAAYRENLILGTATNQFSPNFNITHQEAAVMITRAAKRCGMQVSVPLTECQNILSSYQDQNLIAVWAKESLAFCAKYGIIGSSEELSPTVDVTRSEIAAMLHTMLNKAGLI